MGSVKNKSFAWLSYTAIRVALVVLVWFGIQFFTPVRGVFAVVLALLISAVFSIAFLGKQRDAMSESMFGFFRRLNERIDAGAAKEDYFEDEQLNQGSQNLDKQNRDLQGKSDGESNPVDQQQVPGGLEDGDQGGTAGSSTN